MDRKKSTRNYKACVICKRRRMPNSDVFLAQLPKDPIRCRQWVKMIGQQDLVNVPIKKLQAYKHVCDKHFKQEDFNTSKTRLLKHAVPTLNLIAEPLPDESLRNFPVLHRTDQNVPPDESQISYRRNLVRIPEQDLAKIALFQVKGVLHDRTNSNPVPSSSSVPSTSTATEIHEEMGVLHDTTIKNYVLSTSSVPSTSTTITEIHKEIGVTSTNPVPSSSSVPSTSTAAEIHEEMDVSASGIPSEIISVKNYKRKKPSKVLKGLTSREETLLKELKSTKLSLRKLSKTSLDLEKLNNETLKMLVLDAIKNHKKKPTGRRWNIKTKLWALAIYKRSPKAYRYLEWALPIPGTKSIQRLLKNVPLEPGINKKLIQKLGKIIKKLDPKDKYCALLFDEVALKKRLIFNEGTDKIEGFQDLGESRENKVADHALVFMIQGLHKKYKQPVAYYFVKGTVSTENLVVLIKNNIRCLNEADFEVVTTVCDQGPTNVGALNMLKRFGGQCTDDNFFNFDDFKIFIMFDIPHLFKSIRNNFYNAGEIHYNGKIGKWSHLIEAEQRNNNFLNFRKINKNVIHPTYKAKMRVKFAAHALSHTMSAILKMLSWKHETHSEEILETAYIIEELDKLFDFCNGPSSPKDIKKGLRENVSQKTKHVEMWRYFLNRIEGIKFLKSDSRLQLKNVRCIQGFKISIKSLLDIWLHVKEKGFKYLNLRQLNQDALENLFGIIRQHSPTNSNPTCSLFTAALKSSILSGLTAPHSSGSNCEQDYNKLILDFKNDLVESPVPQIDSRSDKIDDNSVPVLSLPEWDEDFIEIDLSSFEEQPVVYVSGFLASKIEKINKCQECNDCLTTTNVDEDIYKYISYKEWWEEKKSLTYPSSKLCQMVYKSKTIFENNLKPDLYKNDILKICIMTLSVDLDMSWYHCKIHQSHNLIRILCKLLIRQYCKIQNENLAEQESKIGDSYKKAQQQSIT